MGQGRNNIVYITGAGIISALGNGLDETRKALLDGKSGVGEIGILESVHHELPCGEVKITDRQLRDMLGIPAGKASNRTALLGIEAIRQAAAQACVAPENAFLVCGTTVGGMSSTEMHFLEMAESGRFLDLLESHDSASTTALMASYFGIRGEMAVTVSTACSSSANAVIVGANMIKSGLADIVIAGGSESLSMFHLNGFNSLMVLDTERCRPFDEGRNGLNLGEGAAFVVLESHESVSKRNAMPLAVLSGYGNRCDAFHQTASSPQGEGAFLAMSDALEMAGMEPCDIDYVNAHGTGTQNNDASESSALKRIFHDSMPPVSSTKPFTGHATSASGSIELVICMIAMQYGFVPANLGWKNRMEDGIVPSAEKRNAVLKHVMCNSFGFGGNDSSLIISNIASAGQAHECPHSCLPPVTSLSEIRISPGSPVPDAREFMSAMEARRLSLLHKSSVSVFLSALRDAGISCPDAIIIGTSYGMLENSEKFLMQMCKDGEHGLSPTLFMQSTHNTIAGSIAKLSGCHGYNITYVGSCEEEVLELSMRDARMLMGSGKISNALIGYYNEVTPLFHDLLLRLDGEDVPAGVTVTAKVIKKQ